MDIVPVTSLTAVQLSISTQILNGSMNLAKFMLHMQQDVAAVTEWTLIGRWW